MRRSLPLIAVVAATAIASAACSGGGGGGSPTNTPTPTPTGTQPPGGSWFPLTQGNTWSYQVTKPGAAAEGKTVTIGPLEDEGGAKAGTTGTRVDTTLTSGASQKEWYRDFGSVIDRDRAVQYGPGQVEQTDATYSPTKIYVDQSSAHTAANATWSESYTDSTYDATTGMTTTLNHTITWTVLSTNDPIVVNGTSFSCLEVHRKSSLSSTSGSDKIYWFSPKVGKIKEIDNDPANPTGTPTQVELMTSYTLVP